MLDSEYILEETDINFKETGLKKTSVFKMDKIMTIEKSIVKRYIGKANIDLMKMLDEKIKIALKLIQI